MNGLTGKVAVITGASSGIGEATAEALAAEGASVVVAARREDRLEDLVERIDGKDGGKALAVACDVTDEQQAHDLIKRGRDEFGRVDPSSSESRRSGRSWCEPGFSTAPCTARSSTPANSWSPGWS